MNDFNSKYSTDREKILYVIQRAQIPLDYAQIANSFKHRFSYLPSIERRLRELVKKGLIKRIPGPIPKFELIK